MDWNAIEFRALIFGQSHAARFPHRPVGLIRSNGLSNFTATDDSIPNLRPGCAQDRFRANVEAAPTLWLLRPAISMEKMLEYDFWGYLKASQVSCQISRLKEWKWLAFRLTVHVKWQEGGRLREVPCVDSRMQIGGGWIIEWHLHSTPPTVGNQFTGTPVDFFSGACCPMIRRASFIPKTCAKVWISDSKQTVGRAANNCIWQLQFLLQSE